MATRCLRWILLILRLVEGLCGSRFFRIGIRTVPDHILLIEDAAVIAAVGSVWLVTNFVVFFSTTLYYKEIIQCYSLYRSVVLLLWVYIYFWRMDQMCIWWSLQFAFFWIGSFGLLMSVQFLISSSVRCVVVCACLSTSACDGGDKSLKSLCFVAWNRGDDCCLWGFGDIVIAVIALCTHEQANIDIWKGY